MASYLEWNDAIAEFVVRGAPPGASVYLAVDDDLLARVGFGLLGELEDPLAYRHSFEAALRLQLQEKKRQLDRFEFREDPFPEAVGFLAGMVLAAYDMVGQDDHDSGTISANNYFLRFREVFGDNDHDTGRPSWLQPNGIEEVLWMKWNLWLAERGWNVTAERGEHLNDKYIQYPISQALLRKTDSRKIVSVLRQEEHAGRVRRDWDPPLVTGWLLQHAKTFGSTHLKSLVYETTDERLDAVSAAVFDLYDAIDWEHEHDDAVLQMGGPKRLMAGIQRDEDPVTGDIAYFVFPHRPRRLADTDSLRVTGPEGECELRAYRADRFEPGWEWQPGVAGSFPVGKSATVSDIVLPERDFWILVDPPDGLGGPMEDASGRLALGDAFVVLARGDASDEMERLAEQELVAWDDRVPPSGSDGWEEFRSCRVTSLSWRGFIPIHDALVRALEPVGTASIRFHGGLRQPGRQAWFADALPGLEVVGPDILYKLVLRKLDGREPLWDVELRAGTIFAPEEPEPGVYVIEASAEGRVLQRRQIVVHGWDTIELRPPGEPYWVRVEKLRMCGAVLEPTAEDSLHA